jgi:hypothetical protein
VGRCPSEAGCRAEAPVYRMGSDLGFGGRVSAPVVFMTPLFSLFLFCCDIVLMVIPFFFHAISFVFCVLTVSHFPPLD